jgi:hypothetical protein
LQNRGLNPAGFFHEAAGGKPFRFTLTKEEDLNGSKLPIPAQQTRLIVHPHAQRNAFRRRDARQ